MTPDAPFFRPAEKSIHHRSRSKNNEDILVNAAVRQEMKHTRREDFARFFCHVIEADPALYRGILCYLATLAAIVVIRLAVDSTGAWLMGMVKPSRAPLPHPSMVTGEEQHDEEEQEEAAGMHKEIALLAFLVGLELVQDVLRKHMFVLLNKFVRDPFHIAGVRYALTAIHNSSPHWISGMNPR